ncbi:MAG: dihydropyrimidinase [Lachnospiraceae bacterium]|nr:dihydropyrimidinase [Lachnospiraceae bacterium]
MDYIIKGGTVINPDGRFKGDVRITDGIISEISPEIASITAENVIEADGLFVLPGGIDSHTHLEMKMGDTYSADDYESGTVAAACGGITTVFDYTLQENGRSMLDEIQSRYLLAREKACVDYAFHGGISEVNPERLSELEEMRKQGFTSIKAYMTYAFGLDDYSLYKLLKAAAAHQILITVHAESDAMVRVNREELIEKGKTDSAWYHYLSRPEAAEEEADIRAVKLALAAGAPVYIVHLGNAAGETYISSCKEKEIRVYAETCPQYLEFTNEVYKRGDGVRFICSPPMKGEQSRDKLWDGVRSGAIDVISTDHCPSQSYEKEWGISDFTKAPNGLMGIENMYPYMLDAANRGMISFERAVELCSNNPSKLFGCSQKGNVAVGKDADLVLYDPQKHFTITKKNMHSRTDYTIYEGKELTGYPVMTVSRGRIVYREGEFTGEAGYGRLIRRETSCCYGMN